MLDFKYQELLKIFSKQTISKGKIISHKKKKILFKDEVYLFLNGEIDVVYYTTSGKEKLLFTLNSSILHIIFFPNFETKNFIPILFIPNTEVTLAKLKKNDLSKDELISLYSYITKSYRSLLEDLIFKIELSSHIYLAFYIYKNFNSKNYFKILDFSRLAKLLSFSRVTLYKTISKLQERNILKQQTKNSFEINHLNLKKYLKSKI